MSRERTETEANELLTIAYRRFNNLINTLPIGIVITTGDGIIEAVNPAVVRMLGFSERELVREPLWKMISPGRDNVNFQQWAKETLDKTIEITALDKYSEHVPVDVTVNLLEADASGRLVVLIQDVTERVMIERIKREFYQMINHDIRSPLSSVSAFIEMLLVGDTYGTLNDSGKARLKLALDNVTHVTNLASNLLDLERLRDDRGLVQLSSVNLRNIAEEAMARVQELADRKGVRLEALVGPVEFTGDQLRLVQVIVNLSSNAIEYSPAGSSVQILSYDSPDLIKVEVRDQGPGIPANARTAIFERFKRNAPSSTSGFGLGLAICGEIVRKHGGDIGCLDAPGGGTIFWFTLRKTATI